MKTLKAQHYFFILSFLIISALAFGGLANASDFEYKRIYGHDRIGTAISISQQGWPLGLDNIDKSVILARADDPADALASASLVGIKDAPILLTNSKNLPVKVLGELKRLGAKKIYVLGGKGAISEAVVQDLASHSYQVKRIEGRNRYETAAKINEVAGTSQAEEAILVNGITVADALSASSVSAIMKVPIYLASRDSIQVQLPPNIKKVKIFGGTGAISESVEESLIKQGIQVTRIAGSDRFSTNIKANDSFQIPNDKFILVRGLSTSLNKEDYPDAVTAAGLANRLNAKVILARPTEIVPDIKTYLKDKQFSLYILGGNGALSQETIKNYGFPIDKIEIWPVIEVQGNYQELVNNAIDLYHQTGYEYSPYLENYNSLGDYLTFGRNKEFVETDRITFDKDGIPKVKYGTEYYYNPVTIAQYALTMYGKYVNGDLESLDKFLYATDVLLSLQDEKGAFRYPFSWRYYLTNEVYQPGWVSGMAQGQALSVLSRAYHVTQDEKYLNAGNLAFEFLITPLEQGGVMSSLSDLNPSLKDYIIFEEYISEPNSFTLNGYMFTLLGIYDWANITNSNEVSGYFNSGIRTLEKILPYYDVGGFTCYDLGHLFFNKDPHINVKYHQIHIYLLHALHSLTQNDYLKYYENKWAEYVQ